MYKAILFETNKLKEKQFSGSVKFGIEYGKIVNEVISSVIKNKELQERDFENELQNIQAKNFFGTVEVNFLGGKLLNYEWSSFYKGEQLQERLGNLCRNVRCVVKR